MTINAVDKTVLIDVAGRVFAPPAPPSSGVFFVDDFETGSRASDQNGAGWTTTNSNSNGDSPVISSAIAHTGNFSMRFRYLGSAPNTDSFSEQRFKLGGEFNEIWLEYYIYYQDGTEGFDNAFESRDSVGPDNNKFHRFWDIDQGNPKIKFGFSTFAGPTQGLQDRLFGEYGHNGTVGQNGNHGGPYAGDSGNDWIPKGVWTRIVIQVICATVADNDGVLKLWTDGVLTIDNEDLKNYPDGGVGNFMANMYFQGFSNSGFDATTSVFIDNVKFSTESLL